MPCILQIPVNLSTVYTAVEQFRVQIQQGDKPSEFQQNYVNSFSMCLQHDSYTDT